MRIVHLSTYETLGGAARAARRLHLGLRRLGHDSLMLVRDRSTDDPSTRLAVSGWTRAAVRASGVVEYALPRLHRRWSGGPFGAALLPVGTPGEVRALQPDVAHVHWTGEGFLRPESMPRLGAPIVWTLHDSHAFTGGCHLPLRCTRFETRCGECPVLGSRRTHDLSRLNWWRKQRAYSHLDLTVVTPSRWLAGRARASSLLGQRRIECIPNGIDLQVFRPLQKETARGLLGLPQHVPLASFVAVGAVQDPVKGFVHLAAALRTIHETNLVPGLQLAIAGSSALPAGVTCGVPVLPLGALRDELTVALLASAVDVAVVPSLEENQPNTVLEAYACGTPVVAFRVGGLPELIADRETGVLVEPFQTDDLARAMQWVLGEPGRARALGEAGRQRVVREYALELQARRYAALYEELLARGAAPPRG